MALRTCAISLLSCCFVLSTTTPQINPLLADKNPLLADNINALVSTILLCRKKVNFVDGTIQIISLINSYICINIGTFFACFLSFFCCDLLVVDVLLLCCSCSCCSSLINSTNNNISSPPPSSSSITKILYLISNLYNSSEFVVFIYSI